MAGAIDVPRVLKLARTVLDDATPPCHDEGRLGSPQGGRKDRIVATGTLRVPKRARYVK